MKFSYVNVSRNDAFFQNLGNSIILKPKNGGLKAWSHSVRKAYSSEFFSLRDLKLVTQA